MLLLDVRAVIALEPVSVEQVLEPTVLELELELVIDGLEQAQDPLVDHCAMQLILLIAVMPIQTVQVDHAQAVQDAEQLMQ